MPITWRPGTWNDVEPGLSIDPSYRGDALISVEAAIESWRHLVRDRFFTSAAIESQPPIKGRCLVAFGASVLVSSSFADSEIANPRPHINSRIIASLYEGKSVLATYHQVACANSGDGIDIVVLCGAWRDEILDPLQKQEVQILLAKSFTEQHSGYRIRRILVESASERTREFLDRSSVYRSVAEFRGTGRALHMMTRESSTAVLASLGGVLFSSREPSLRLRSADQQLLVAAISGATDQELSTRLGLSLSAVKARWRSAVARVEEIKPGLVHDTVDRDGRGMQKRHLMLAYVRNHPEELRPFDWKRKSC